VRAIDTNIVVRIVADDHEQQVAHATAALAKGDIYLSLTVCLETVWVLRSVYRMPSAAIADSLTKFAGIPGMEIENPEALFQAIEWLREGMDFADALHLAGAAHCSAMLSFDGDFAKAAKQLGTTPVIEP